MKVFSSGTKTLITGWSDKRKEILTSLRKNSILAYGTVRIFAEQEMLVVERAWEQKKILLKINMTDKEKEVCIAENGKLLSSHRYGTKLSSQGYVIMEVD